MTIYNWPWFFSNFVIQLSLTHILKNGSGCTWSHFWENKVGTFSESYFSICPNLYPVKLSTAGYIFFTFFHLSVFLWCLAVFLRYCVAYTQERSIFGRGLYLCTYGILKWNLVHFENVIPFPQPSWRSFSSTYLSKKLIGLKYYGNSCSRTVRIICS